MFSTDTMPFTDTDDIVEIPSSSPDKVQAWLQTGRRRAKRPLVRYSTESVIDITSDEDDPPLYARLGKNGNEDLDAEINLPGPSVKRGMLQQDAASGSNLNDKKLHNYRKQFSPNLDHTDILVVEADPIPLFKPENDEDMERRRVEKRSRARPPQIAVQKNERPFPSQAVQPPAVALDQPVIVPEVVFGPPSFEDAITGYVASILEIIPDVESMWLSDLVKRSLPNHGSKTVEQILHHLFESPNYPKSERHGKRKRADEPVKEREVVKPKIDYANKDRESTKEASYVELALNQLLVDFPTIPKPFVRASLFQHNRLYAPTHLYLLSLKDQARLPYVPKRPSKGKGRAPQIQNAEFEAERAWLLGHLASEGEGTEVGVPSNQKVDEDDEDGDIECGCCFGSFSFDKMIQCVDTHLFCTRCVNSYAATQLGGHNAVLVCMDQSGCKQPFPASELRRILPEKLMALYERLTQDKEIKAAGLEGLEECPFCDYKVVIENPNEKLFRCEGESCGAVSCRQCKKAVSTFYSGAMLKCSNCGLKDHLPKSCKEMEEDKILDGRHTIEEAMTRALLRNCPKCQKVFVKQDGCNKMTCPICYAVSCYVCRKIINGYDHFDQRRHAATTNLTPGSGQCLLWDAVETRHNQEVTEAAKKAMEEYRRENPEADEAALKVALPHDQTRANPARGRPGLDPVRMAAMPPPPVIPPNPIQVYQMQMQMPLMNPMLPQMPIFQPPAHPPVVPGMVAPYDVNYGHLQPMAEVMAAELGAPRRVPVRARRARRAWK